MIQRVVVLLLLCIVIAVPALAADAARFRLAPGTTPVNEQNFNYDTFGNLSSLTTKTAWGMMRSGFAVYADTNQLNGVCPRSWICLLSWV